MNQPFNSAKHRIVVVCIMLIIGVLHIINLKSHLHGAGFILYISYFSDFILPIAAYFLFYLVESHFPFFKNWRMKMVLAFLIPSFAETCQYLSIPLLGVTFDTLDYLAYALGATMAVLIDRQILPRLLPFWTA